MLSHLLIFFLYWFPYRLSISIIHLWINRHGSILLNKMYFVLIIVWLSHNQIVYVKLFVIKMQNNELIIPQQCTKLILSLIVLAYKTKIIVQKSSNVNAFYWHYHGWRSNTFSVADFYRCHWITLSNTYHVCIIR